MIFTRLLPLFLAIGPLAAQAEHGHGQPKGCKPATTKTVWVTEFITSKEPEQSSSQDASSMMVPSMSLSSEVSSPSSEPTSTTKKHHGGGESSSMQSATSKGGDDSSKTSSQSSMTSQKAKSTETASPTSSTGGDNGSSDFGLFPDATNVNIDIHGNPTSLCGNDERLQLDGLGLGVANSMYNSDSMEGTQCTNYKDVLEAGDGTDLVEYISETDITPVADTENICKGYSNIGIGKNLKTPVQDIKSIPVSYEWSREVDTLFKGSNIFDCITSETKGMAGDNPDSSEFMLFLYTWGNQTAIGQNEDPVAKFDMFGTSWKLYEGKNAASGVTVRSMLPDTPFEGSFQGDLAEWINAMVKKGYIKGSHFLNICNLGTELFYGKTTQTVRASFNINL